MKKSIRFIIITLFVVSILAGLYIYSLLFVSNIDDKNPERYIGTYELTDVPYVEKILLMRKNKTKRAFFSDDSTRKRVVYLQDNFKQRYENYWTKRSVNDSLIREGTWEIKNDTIVLHFPDETFQLKIVQMGYTKKFYHIGDAFDCKDRETVIGQYFHIFRKIN